MSKIPSPYAHGSQALGYTPFEYWKGPKPVSWTYLKEKKEKIGVGSGDSGEAQPRRPRNSREKPPLSSISVGSRGPRLAVSAVTPTTTTGGQQPVLLHVAQPVIYGRPSVRQPKTGVTGMQNRFYGPSYPQASPGGGFDSDCKHGHIRSSQAGSRHESAPSSSPPPKYVDIGPRDSNDTMGHRFYEQMSAPWYEWRSWSKRIWAYIAVGIVVILIIIIIVPVEVSKTAHANSYPDYTPLNYTLKDTYSGANFFDNFDYLNGLDKSNGFVHYADPNYAKTYNLTFATADSAVARVDTSLGPGTTPDASTGRLSIRLGSKIQYNSGLFIFDVKHAPTGCGTWPALWLTDMANWPQNGEIDVMEQVNQNNGNLMTLHTDQGCSMDGVKRIQTGAAAQGDCNEAVNSNAGCGVTGSNSTYGPAFNSQGGGVMAVEWRTEGIRMWQFARSAIPSDITSQNPSPNTWGSALADFPDTGCDVASHFKNQSIIINTDLCGVWAGSPSVYSGSGCPSNCTDFVANNPSAFANAYWEFGGFQVYNSI